MSQFDHIDIALLRKYSEPGPRYTSYPTAPLFTESFTNADFSAEIDRSNVDSVRPLSLYFHLPFCDELCYFCGCTMLVTRKAEKKSTYIDYLRREMDLIAPVLSGTRKVVQVHWGGGTPTWLSPDEVARLFRAVTGAFPPRQGAEASIEVHPPATHVEHVAVLAECGSNRISLGVQDFEPEVQEKVHRIEPAEVTAGLVASSLRAGFDSVNFDLIYGLPYQSEESFARTLDVVIAMEPDRIALYSYAHVTWVAKQQRGFERVDLPDPATKLAIMLMAIRRFLAEGYQFVGLDHFARPEDELSTALTDRTLRRNFMGHTAQAGVDLIGFGPSAISELRGSYAQSQRDLGAWQETVESAGVATLRGHRLSRDDIERRFIIGRIMCLGELRAAEFEAEFGRPFAASYSRELTALEPLLADGLVARSQAGSLVVTPLGRLLVRNVAMAFDAYLPQQRDAGRPMFSKTV